MCYVFTIYLYDVTFIIQVLMVDHCKKYYVTNTHLFIYELLISNKA